PRRLVAEVRKIELGYHHDRVVRSVARNDDGGVAVRLVHGLVRWRRKSAQIEHVRPQVRDQSIQTALLERVEQPTSITEPGRKRSAFEPRQHAATLRELARPPQLDAPGQRRYEAAFLHRQARVVARRRA